MVSDRSKLRRYCSLLNLRRIARWYGRRWMAPLRGRRVAAKVEHVSGPKNIDLGPTDLVVLCVVRDGAPHLESFLEHHFRLGARWAVLLDNGSSDNTQEIARRADNVVLLRCGLPFEKYQYEYHRYMISRFGSTSWALIIDIDERFDYPYSNRLPLPDFLSYLNNKGFTAVAAHLLDLFPEGPLHSWPPAGRALIEASHWYDISGVLEFKPRSEDRRNEYADPPPRHLKGGIRKTAFGIEPMITKHPLLYQPGGARPVSHSSHFCSGGRVADLSCLLAHYKFDSGFRERCRRAVREGNYYDRSREYRVYMQTLKKEPDLNLKRATARRFRGVDELVDEGFLSVSEDYRAFVRRFSSCGVPG